MTDIWTTAAAGAVAGLGVAVPVGAIGVLLVQESMRSRGTAMAAASAVAVVDMAYAALATALGPLVASALSGVEAWVRLASALILAGIAAHGLWSSVRGRGAPAGAESGQHLRPANPGRAAEALQQPDPGRDTETGLGTDAGRPGPYVAPTESGRDVAAAGRADAESLVPPLGGQAGAVRFPHGPVTAGRLAGRAEPVARPRPGRVFAQFAALTAVNPTTALYFAALTTAQGAALQNGAAGAVFVGGVLVASLAWQQFLVAAGGYAGARISDTARAWTFRIGFGLVAVYAVNIALPLP
ncbi:hypothetical protein J7E88_13110 [Streptomyces sp. ISL-10]|uniref:hypothetical protein n=1 Tax=Streptomyces sp. ISL-10 TaxID=2819172 RepID=UPI001BE8A386|nr:hypothetical protein [Streptomyces sp. ISL-10]MBT2366222.1 hypothetical protein [Streptomyces sp. ISL-10]